MDDGGVGGPDLFCFDDGVAGGEGCLTLTLTTGEVA